MDFKELDENLKLKRAVELANVAVYKNYHSETLQDKELSPKTT